MLVARATVQGRLSERFGSRSIGLDRRMRILGLRHAAERNLASLPASAVRVLEAYSRGVNAFLQQVEAEPVGRGAPELFLFSTGAVERWTPVDSIGVIKLMSLRLSGDAQQELEQGRFASLLPRSLLRSLYPPYPDAAVVAPGDPEPAFRQPSDPVPAAGPEPGPDRPPGDETAPGTTRSEAAPAEETVPRGDSGEAVVPDGGSPEGSRDAEPGPETAPQEVSGDATPGPEIAPQEVSGDPAPSGSSAAEGVTAEEAAEERVDEPPPEVEPAREDLRPPAGPPEPDGPGVPWIDPLGPGGSNSWAADGSRSTSTRPLLANDPHLGLSAPGLWYLARLRFQHHDVIGATIPGLPIIVAGRNAHLGWGLTSAYVDDQDVYFSEVDETAPNLYRTKEGFAPLRVHTERIYIRGVSEPLVETVRATHHGPVLPPDLYSVSAAVPEGTIASMRWTALEPHDQTVIAGLDLMQAPERRGGPGSAAEILVAGAKRRSQQIRIALPLPSPGACRFVTIFTRPGDVCHRPDGNPATNGRDTFRLKDFRDPSTRQVVLWQTRTTARRTNRFRGTSPPIGRVPTECAGFTTSSRSVIFIPWRVLLVFSPTRFPMSRSHCSPVFWIRFSSTRSPARTPTVSEPPRWSICNDGTARWMPRGAEPLIFTAWMRHLSRKLLENWIGTDAGVGIPFRPMFLERVFASGDSNSQWCDDQATESPETCRFAALKALDTALEELTGEYGSDIDGWQWGRAHGAIHRHLPLGFTSPASALFNIRHDYGGSNFTLSRAGSSGVGENPYATVSGAGYRAIYDLANPDRSRFIAATGQSGHFLSQHYDDLTAIWRRNQYLPMQLQLPKDIKRTAGILYLVPSGSEASE